MIFSRFLRSIQILSCLDPKVEITLVVLALLSFFLREIKRCIFCFIQNDIKILSLTSIFHKQLIIKITQLSKKTRAFDYKKVKHVQKKKNKKSATLYFYESWEIRLLTFGYLVKRNAKSRFIFFYLNQILTHTLGVVTISDLRCLLDSFTVVDFIAKRL